MPHSTRKSLARLSRTKLLELCVSWSKSATSEPYLVRNRNHVETEEEDYLHETARKRSDLVETYRSLQTPNPDYDSLTKNDIIDRVVDGDWRRGLTFKQLAEIDLACLEENDTLLRWSALQLRPRLDGEEREEPPKKRRKIARAETGRQLPQYPNITAPIFAENLHKHIAPLVKAHYHVHRLQSLGLSIVRLCMTPNKVFAPVNMNVPRSERAGLDQSRLIYIALPDSCPYIYISTTGGRSIASNHGSGSSETSMNNTMLKRVVLEAIPKALSRPQLRWTLEPTRVTAKSLRTISLLRGGSQVGVTGGSLSNILQTSEPDASDQEDSAEQHHLARVRETEQRFGRQAGDCHPKVDRFQLSISNLIRQRPPDKDRQAQDTDQTPVAITFNGTDVFAGLKKLAIEYPGCVDLQRLPGLLTGESNFTSATL